METIKILLILLTLYMHNAVSVIDKHLQKLFFVLTILLPEKVLTIS